MTVQSGSWSGWNWYSWNWYLPTFIVVPGHRKDHPDLVPILEHFACYFLLFDVYSVKCRDGAMNFRMDQDDYY